MADLPVTLEKTGGTKSGSILDIVKSGQGLLDIFAGKTATGNSSQTTQTALSPEAVKALLDQILGGTQGLAQVSSGQKAAGFYNSPVTTLLTNDLLSRAAGEVAVKSAPTTTTGNTTQVQLPQMSLGKSLLGLGASVAGKKVMAATGVDKKLDDMVSSIFGSGKKGSSFDLEDESLGRASESFASSGGATSIDQVSEIIGGGFSGGGDAFTSAIDSGAIFGSLGDTGFSLSADAIDAGGLFGSLGDAGDFIGGAGDAADAAGAIGDFAGGSIPIAGPLIRLASGDAKGAVGSAVGGAVGSFFGPVGTVVGSTIGGAIGGGSVICTECYYNGDMTHTRYIASKKYGENHFTARAGYHIWGKPAVKLMRRSRIFYSLARYLANSYAAHVNGEGNIVGATIVKLGYPICWLLGKIKQWHKPVSIPAY